jgi:hypothetical protein
MVEMMPFWREAPSKSDSVQGTSDTGSESEHWATLVRVQLQAPLAWLDLRVRVEELLQEEALGPGVMASGVKVATITRLFSVDKRSEEEKDADRKFALAKWHDEENATGRLAHKKEAEAAVEAKRLASKRPVGRPKKVRQVQAVLVGQEGEEGNLEDGGEEPPAKKKKGPYTNWFVPDLWNFIFATVKKHPRNLYDALFSFQHNKKPGRLSSPFDKLTVQTLKGWFEKNEEGGLCPETQGRRLHCTAECEES